MWLYSDKKNQRPESSGRTKDVNAVGDLALNQENAPQTHRLTRHYLTRETGIRHSLVSYISAVLKKCRAQQLITAANWAVCLTCSRQLDYYDAIDFIFSSDNKVFYCGVIGPPSERSGLRTSGPSGLNYIELENEVVVAMCYNLRPPDVVPVVRGPREVWSRSAYPFLTYNVFTADTS